MRLLSKCALPALVIACLCLSGCYHAHVTTNKEAGETVVQKKWASSFLFGLVPATVDVSDQCSNGIASAERELSFLNMVVGGLTFNIYTPQSVTVTCAASGSMSEVGPRKNMEFMLREGASIQAVKATVSSAAMASAVNGDSVTVRIVRR
ncbi:MAG: Bor/Iss family lipoprotein [Salinibacter sp.]